MDEGDPRLFWIPYMDETLEEFCRRLLRSKMNMKRKGIHQFLTFFTLVFLLLTWEVRWWWCLCWYCIFTHMCKCQINEGILEVLKTSSSRTRVLLTQ